MKVIATKRRRCVVDRKTWARGGINGNARLLNNEGCKCCFGFLAEQVGITLASMRNESSPSCTHLSPPSNIRFLLDEEGGDKAWVHEAMMVNDDEGILDGYRESELIRLFSENGIDLIFEN